MTHPTTTATGFLAELHLGRLRWDLLTPFPEQTEADRAQGDAAVAELMRFLKETLDPTEVDRTAQLPDGFHDACVARGYFRLQDDTAVGGLGLSALNAFRMIQAAASWSVTACYAMSVHLGLGAGAYLPMLADGELKDELTRLLEAGAISGDADTEPAGAINRSRATTAVPTEDGTGFLISGEKVFIQNGPIAGLLRVSATVHENGRELIRLFFVDTADPGFHVKSWHEYLGLKGLPNAALTFDQVFVPHSRVFSLKGLKSEGEWRQAPELHTVSVRGRMYPISAPALAIGRLCLHWSREFIQRRRVEGRGLEQYDEIQRIVAATLAEVFAMESVVEWCLLAEQQHPGIDLDAEQTVAKNINSMTSWRIVDRTLSLLAAEGFETARSKARRGAQPLPVERFFRDARALRVAGGVDFMVDHWAARRLLSRHYPEPQAIAEAPTDLAGQDRSLSERNRRHLRFVAEQSVEFAVLCRSLTDHHGDPEELFARERTLILLNQISAEMFSMSVVLARAARLHPEGSGPAQDLADVFCAEARHRIADARRRLDDEQQPEHAGLCAQWLHGDGLEFLLRDTVTDTPPVTCDDLRPGMSR
ncbi:alkylation response protein AidB-like acyl-CoA dehydrogenase [Kitasatospora sp. MAA4]|uniref:acyl-CoA dehydrogenase family protein n=1 Tax=Kitasatospora sp. MAA4 TaxID=3035093 RepID=UPI002473097E|nr:acyl-CoA dehydrogenase family protein [Kitasatospora sp. MAA4]MDH6133740.1 alkylation response protein AidB-like acyl-CoA dehydrogenase [Kitasatospora sp. MAA4]